MRQFANDVATPSPIEVSRDYCKDEIPADRSNHENSTPGESQALYEGRHYAPEMNYGVSVSGSSSSKEIGVNPYAPTPQRKDD